MMSFWVCRVEWAPAEQHADVSFELTIHKMMADVSVKLTRATKMIYVELKFMKLIHPKRRCSEGRTNPFRARFRSTFQWRLIGESTLFGLRIVEKCFETVASNKTQCIHKSSIKHA